MVSQCGEKNRKDGLMRIVDLGQKTIQMWQHTLHVGHSFDITYTCRLKVEFGEEPLVLTGLVLLL